MVITTMECEHCFRKVDELVEFIYNEGDEIVRLGPGCRNCMDILLFHVAQKRQVSLN